MNKDHIVPTIAAVLGGWVFLSLLLSSLGASLILFFPGEFLLESYHLAAFYVPLYLLLCSLAFLSDPLPKRFFLLLNLSVVPFLTLALCLKMTIGQQGAPIAMTLLRLLGKGGSLALLLPLLCLEIVLLRYLHCHLPPDVPPFGQTTRSRLLAWWEKVVHYFFGKDWPQTQSHEEKKVETPESVPPSPSPISIPPFPTPPPPRRESLSWSPDPACSPEQNIDSFFSRVIDGEEREATYNALSQNLPAEETVSLPWESEPSAFPERHVSPPPPSDTSPFSTFEEDHLGVNKGEEHTEGDVPAEDSPHSFESPLPEPLLFLSRSEGSENQPEEGRYKIPIEGILLSHQDESSDEDVEDTTKSAEVLRATLAEFRITAKVTGVRRGPVVTLFELLPSPGVKLSRIVALADNIALRLAASRVRIVAPIPGKHAVGIEIPNKKRTTVSFRSLVTCKERYQSGAILPIFLGQDIGGKSEIIDLTKTPHLLIAGATGSGKSVCVNSLICSLLYHCPPEQVKMLLVDPKIVELKLYNGIPHLLTPVVTDAKRALQALRWCLREMERRYSLLDSMEARDIRSYNARIAEQRLKTTPLSYLILVVDEFADLMATSGKALEGLIARLAAMARAVGIHLVLATQRPSVDVITGLIKANFPSRIAFAVASRTDSRIIIDTTGADTLLGRGDMLFTAAWSPYPKRIQGAFLSEEEVFRVASYVRSLGAPHYIDDEIFLDEEEDSLSAEGSPSYVRDPLFDEALKVVSDIGKASASFLQRRLKIGYNRAARLVEEMEARGIVGAPNGSKPRNLIAMPEEFQHDEDPHHLRP